MNYKERMKYADNEFLYNKCVKQYQCIMNYSYKMREYKERIKELEEENEKLKEQVGQFSNTIHKLGRSNVNMQQRISKGIEYIEKNKEGTDCCGEVYIGLFDEQIEELLSKLKGSK